MLLKNVLHHKWMISISHTGGTTWVSDISIAILCFDWRDFLEVWKYLLQHNWTRNHCWWMFVHVSFPLGGGISFLIFSFVSWDTGREGGGGWTAGSFCVFWSPEQEGRVMTCDWMLTWRTQGRTQSMFWLFFCFIKQPSGASSPCCADIFHWYTLGLRITFGTPLLTIVQHVLNVAERVCKWERRVSPNVCISVSFNSLYSWVYAESQKLLRVMVVQGAQVRQTQQ